MDGDDESVESVLYLQEILVRRFYISFLRSICSDIEDNYCDFIFVVFKLLVIDSWWCGVLMIILLYVGMICKKKINRALWHNLFYCIKTINQMTGYMLFVWAEITDSALIHDHEMKNNPTISQLFHWIFDHFDHSEWSRIPYQTDK